MTTFALPAFFTHDHAVDFMKTFALGARTESGGKVVVDASALEKFDSSALAVLLQCRRDTVALGKSFEISGLPYKLNELANLYGIRDLLETHSENA